MKLKELVIKFIQHPELEKEKLELLTVVGNYGKVGGGNV